MRPGLTYWVCGPARCIYRKAPGGGGSGYAARRRRSCPPGVLACYSYAPFPLNDSQSPFTVPILNLLCIFVDSFPRDCVVQCSSALPAPQASCAPVNPPCQPRPVHSSSRCLVAAALYLQRRPPHHQRRRPAASTSAVLPVLGAYFALPPPMSYLSALLSSATTQSHICRPRRLHHPPVLLLKNEKWAQRARHGGLLRHPAASPRQHAVERHGRGQPGRGRPDQ